MEAAAMKGKDKQTYESPEMEVIYLDNEVSTFVTSGGNDEAETGVGGGGN